MTFPNFATIPVQFLRNAVSEFMDCSTILNVSNSTLSYYSSYKIFILKILSGLLPSVLIPPDLAVQNLRSVTPYTKHLLIISSLKTTNN